MVVTPQQYSPGTIEALPCQKRGRGNPGTRQTKHLYKDVICAFDIETTRLAVIEQSIMYVWMFHLHTPVNITVVGRTWAELLAFWQQLHSELGENERLCIFVHNLSYEFQFLRAIHEWKPAEVFAVSSRRVLKATMDDLNLEFRCSYLHSNMSLDEYTYKMKVKHKKLSGRKYDYTKIRYPWTPLSEFEMNYGINDVVGLCEAIEVEMQADGDNLYTFPLTSTGYVRRDAKHAMRRAPVGFVKQQLPDFEIYKMCREAFRGGDTHANRYYAGRILHDVKSADRSSSYPDVVCNCLFPVSPFFRVGACDFEELVHLMDVRKKALLLRVSITNIRLTDEFWGCPYISRDKCRRIDRGVFDNGRVLTADYLEITITDVDLRIIMQQYSWDDLCATDVAYARYGKLPDSLVQLTIEYYRKKTALKNVEGQEIYYTKSKNKLNSIYGMMAQDPVKQDIIYLNGLWTEARDDPAELLDKYNRKAFLCYQWGCWVTAWARYRLQEGIRLAGDNFVYADTDSVKYLGEIDWEAYNSERIADSKRSGAYATDPQGETHYMGVYEPDGVYAEFSTLGAKKYAYREKPGGHTKVTIAGVTKAKGGKELDKHGGLEAFKPGFIFREAGGTEILYNDDPEITSIEREGHTLHIYPNAVIRDSTYQLGITAEYMTLLEKGRLPIDFWG